MGLKCRRKTAQNAVLPASTGQEVFQMNKVASTDQLGRLISLAGSAIDLVRENKRSAEQTDTLLEVLQTFKDPNRAYPHYDNTGRPHFGPTQVRCLHQIRPGLRLKERNIYNNRASDLVVISYPKQYRDDDWWIKVKYAESKNISEISLQDMSIVPRPIRSWNSNTWLSFQDEPMPCNNKSHNH